MFLPSFNTTSVAILEPVKVWVAIEDEILDPIVVASVSRSTPGANAVPGLWACLALGAGSGCSTVLGFAFCVGFGFGSFGRSFGFGFARQSG